MTLPQAAPHVAPSLGPPPPRAQPCAPLPRLPQRRAACCCRARLCRTTCRSCGACSTCCCPRCLTTRRCLPSGLARQSRPRRCMACLARPPSRRSSLAAPGRRSRHGGTAGQRGAVPVPPHQGSACWLPALSALLAGTAPRLASRHPPHVTCPPALQCPHHPCTPARTPCPAAQRRPQRRLAGHGEARGGHPPAAPDPGALHAASPGARARRGALQPHGSGPTPTAAARASHPPRARLHHRAPRRRALGIPHAGRRCRAHKRRATCLPGPGKRPRPLAPRGPPRRARRPCALRWRMWRASCRPRCRWWSRWPCRPTSPPYTSGSRPRVWCRGARRILGGQGWQAGPVDKRRAGSGRMRRQYGAAAAAAAKQQPERPLSRHTHRAPSSQARFGWTPRRPSWASSAASTPPSTTSAWSCARQAHRAAVLSRLAWPAAVPWQGREARSWLSCGRLGGPPRAACVCAARRAELALCAAAAAGVQPPHAELPPGDVGGGRRHRAAVRQDARARPLPGEDEAERAPVSAVLGAALASALLSHALPSPFTRGAARRAHRGWVGGAAALFWSACSAALCPAGALCRGPTRGAPPPPRRAPAACCCSAP